MGCVCGKPAGTKYSQETPPKERISVKQPNYQNRVSEIRVDRVNSTRVDRVNSTRRDDRVRRKDGSDLRVTLNDEKIVIGSKRVYDDQVEKKRRDTAAANTTATATVGGVNYPNIPRVPKAVEGEQVAAGWPSWLSEVAGEAIKGWLPRRAETFEKLDKIGQGTYSHVYKARDILSGKIVALKKVRFDTDPESVNFMAREILILRRLDHPNIIKLEGLITSNTSCTLFLVFEYMEHDLTGLTSLPSIKFTEPQVKCYMRQLLSGLDHCHSRGVLHRDIKGSNLLINNNGILKIADFGLASFFDSHRTVAMTSRVVTLWYRPPELLLGATEYGVSVDLWSSGCILGELFARKPIMPGRTEVEQLHKIFKLCGSPSEDFWRKSKLPHAAVYKPQQPYKRYVAETFKDFPATAIALLETLLSIEPARRGTAAHALKSEFFTTEPLAADPSSLPNYPPSKEIDAKLREEEAKRQRASRREKLEKGLAVPASHANAELASSVQSRHSHSSTKSRSEIFNSREELASGFPIDPPRQSKAVNGSNKDRLDPQKRVFHSGPLGVNGPPGRVKSVKQVDDPSKAPTRADLSTLSGLVASRTLVSDDHRQKPSSSSQFKVPSQVSSFSGLLNDLESIANEDQKRSDSHQMDCNRAYPKDTTLHGYGSKTNKIAFSGPLLAPSNNTDQMLRDRDRRIQEYARRTRYEKARPAKVDSRAG